MGAIVTLAAHRRWFHPDAFILLTTGFLGSYTTFSGYELNLFDLVAAGQIRRAIAYGLGSLVAGLLGLVAGITVIRWWVPLSASDDQSRGDDANCPD